MLVLDGLITVHEKARSDLELKKFIHELQTQAGFSGCTMFLLTSAFDTDQFPPEHTMVDGLIELQNSLQGRRSERDLQVHKLRGSWFMGGRHSYRITQAGYEIYPRTEALLETPSIFDSADGPKVPIGIGASTICSAAASNPFGNADDRRVGQRQDDGRFAVPDRGPAGRAGDASRLSRKSDGAEGQGRKPQAAADGAGRQDQPAVAPADRSVLDRSRSSCCGRSASAASVGWSSMVWKASPS